MKLWYASVNYGLEQAAGKILKSCGATDIKITESALTFSCPAEIKTKCINNLFLVLSVYSGKSIVDVAAIISGGLFPFPKISGKTFRIIVMDCGKLRSIAPNIMNKMEKNIARQTGLCINRAKPDLEIWLNRRSDGSVYFMLRTQKHPSFDKTLKKGELRADIAEVMLREANAGKDSVIADLFGGWGAIAVAAAESGQYRKIYSGDIKDECVKYQQKRLRGKRDCIVQKWDARKLLLKDRSVDCIVTDPPWGEFEEIDRQHFYDEFAGEAGRILRQNGSLVFLTSAVNEAEAALGKHGFSHSHITLKVGGKTAFMFIATGTA